MSDNPEFNLHHQIVNSCMFLDLNNNFTLACLRNLINARIKAIKRQQCQYRLPLNPLTLAYINKCELQISLLKCIKGWLNLRINSILMQTPPNNYYHDPPSYEIPSPSDLASPSDPPSTS